MRMLQQGGTVLMGFLLWTTQAMPVHGEVTGEYLGGDRHVVYIIWSDSLIRDSGWANEHLYGARRVEWRQDAYYEYRAPTSADRVGVFPSQEVLEIQRTVIRWSQEDLRLIPDSGAIVDSVIFVMDYEVFGPSSDTHRFVLGKPGAITDWGSYQQIWESMSGMSGVTFGQPGSISGTRGRVYWRFPASLVQEVQELVDRQRDAVYVGVKKLVEADEGQNIYLEMGLITLAIYYRVPPEYVVYPEVTLLWPNAPGIVVEEGQTYAVRYSARAEDRLSAAYAFLSLDDGGNTFPELINQNRYIIPPESVANDTLEWTVTTPPSYRMRVLMKVRSLSGRVSSDTSDYDIGYKLARPGNPQLSITNTGLSFTWEDRSNYETRYMLKARAFSWDGDTLEGAKYLTGANGTSAFVAWGDPFWDFIPAGTALKKIVVGVYAARDTVINGDSVRFFSDVVWAETLRPAPPALVSVNVVADSGIRIQWDGAPAWASHVAATLWGVTDGQPTEHRSYFLSTNPNPGSALIAWTSSFWDRYTTLSDRFRIRLYSRRALGTQGQRALTREKTAEVETPGGMR